MEALCTPRYLDICPNVIHHVFITICSLTRSGELTPSQLCGCLAALGALLESGWAREQLSRQRAIMVELCNVMHRQLLTQVKGLLVSFWGLLKLISTYMLQDTSATQAAVLVVVSHVLTAASESLAGERR